MLGIIHSTMRQKTTTVCKICDQPERCKSLCKAHYSQSVCKSPCKKCGKPVWRDKRSPRRLCKKCGSMKGADNPNAKLSANQVRAIRREYAMGEIGSTRIARKFGVTKATVLRIVKHMNWK